MSTDANASGSKDAARSSLDMGLAKLERQAFAEAIEPLQRACQASKRPKDVLKAKLGLVKAYAECDRGSDAIELCQTLTQHSSPKVQQWAQQTLDILVERFPQSIEPEPDSLGFVPISAPTSNSIDPPDLGFKPLEETPKTQHETIHLPLSPRLPSKPGRKRKRDEAKRGSLSNLLNWDSCAWWNSAVSWRSFYAFVCWRTVSCQQPMQFSFAIPFSDRFSFSI